MNLAVKEHSEIYLCVGLCAFSSGLVFIPHILFISWPSPIENCMVQERENCFFQMLLSLILNQQALRLAFLKDIKCVGFYRLRLNLCLITIAGNINRRCCRVACLFISQSIIIVVSGWWWWWDFIGRLALWITHVRVYQVPVFSTTAPVDIALHCLVIGLSYCSNQANHPVVHVCARAFLCVFTCVHVRVSTCRSVCIMFVC